MKAEARGVQSVEVGARLLDALAESGRPMMLKELAQAAQLLPAQAHAYLVSFRKQGMVEQDGQAGRYRLGPFALELGMARMRGFDPIRMASDGAAVLSRETGLTVLLSVWGAFGPTVIMVHESPGQVHMNTRVGTVYSLTGTATGRVFASFLPDHLVADFMKTERSKWIAARRVGDTHPLARSDCAAIRARGFAIADPQPVPGINAAAAPVLDQLGQVQLVVTLVGPEEALATIPSSEMVQRLLATTRRLSWQLGYGGGGYPADENEIAARFGRGGAPTD